MPNVVIGQRFGAYEILRLIGTGGMGTVYLASRADDLYEQNVAIKLARIPLAGDPGMLSRFRSERQILANLNHPNIGKLLDGGITTTGIPFLVMEYVEGIPIDIFCQHKQLDTAGRLRIFCSVCSAVEYAHKHLVVHRDIKPANILVNAEGLPKLLDFGIAKLLEPNLGMQAQTVDRMMTPEYASPEQMRCEPVTTATDVYALGVLLYKLLTGCLPLQLITTSPLEAAMVICEQAPAPPSEIVRRSKAAPPHGAAADAHHTLRGDLDNIVLAALSKEPSRRYASVASFAADIDAYFHGYPVKAIAPSWSYRVAKFIQRNKAAASAGAAMLLALSGFTIAMTLERNRANREAETSRHVTEFMTDMFKISDPSVSHGDTITARELLDKASSGIEAGLSKDPQVQARLMRTMGSSYKNLGLYPQSVALLERAVGVQTKLLGNADPETLQTMSMLGAAYGGLDRYPESEKLLRQTLAEQQRIVGSDNEATMVTLDTLADTLTREGRYAEAEGLLRKVLVAQRRILGPENRALLFSNNRLTDNLRNQGRYVEAENIARDSLAINQRVLGPYDAVTLSSIEELALIVINEGHPEEAEKLDREGLRISTHLYGPDNEHTLLELGDIGDALQEQGRLTEAEPIQREVVEHLRKTAGPKAAHTIEMMTTLAITLSMEKKFAEAESVSRDALDASLQTLGAASVQSIDNTVNLALILAHEMRSGESEALFKRAVATSSKTEGNTLANVFYAYAEGMAILGHSDEAVDRLKQAIDHGFSNRQQLAADDDLESLRTDPRYQAIFRELQ
ncbi:serine/threonine-protein kinase [Acidisarcina polymorpha]|nr:serine/threonine-protein kinase [Acidisarcina polymorpha]